MQTNMSLMGLIEENDDLDPMKLNKTPLQVADGLSDAAAVVCCGCCMLLYAAAVVFCGCYMVLYAAAVVRCHRGGNL